MGKSVFELVKHKFVWSFLRLKLRVRVVDKADTRMSNFVIE